MSSFIMKAKKHTRHIPIVALTADNTIQTRKLCENYGVSAYLTKPISRHTLIQTIQTFLP
jgi:CheY-like chemotaxis protein